jgi:hypothetical protein
MRPKTTEPVQPKAKGMSGLTVGAMIVGGVGAVLLAGGLITSTVFPRLIDAERTRIASLPQLDAAALEGPAPGQDLLVEGRVSRAQPALFRDFVAYVRQEREQTDGQPKAWTGRERRTPPLAIDLPGGAIRIVNATYDLRDTVSNWTDPRVNGRIETRYIGLVADEPVLIVGKTAAGGVDASFVATGTRQSYLDAEAGRRVVARWLGAGLAGVGVLLLIVAAALIVIRFRRA